MNVRPRLPPPVLPGSRVGIAALSGAVDAARLAAGCAELERLGFEPVPAANLSRREGLCAGSDRERVDAFHTLVDDPGIAAVIFARGGHGLLRLLPGLDWQRIGRHPRAYVGYSDLTPFLLQVVHRLGWVAFHGPMVAADFARGLQADEETSLLAALAGEPVDVPLAGGGRRWGPAPVRGLVSGGCLSLLAASVGTGWSVRGDGALWFWEEVAEPLYRIDRLLNQLTLAGSFDGIAGMLVGHVTPPEGDPEEAARLAGGLDPLLAELAEERHLPVVAGLPAGHATPNWTLALGLHAEVEGAELRYLRDGR